MAKRQRKGDQTSQASPSEGELGHMENDTPGFLDFLKLFQEREEQRRHEEVVREERRRQEEAAREEKLQTLLLSMMQFQIDSHQKEKKELEDARLREIARGGELEEQRLAELEQQRQIEEKRHLELLALEREKLEAERVRQAERDSAKRQEEARRLREREMDRKLKEAPPFPRMTETADVELYVSDFEHHMQDLEIPSARWLTSLRHLLSNWARETLDLIDECDRVDYRKVKKTLLTAYCNEKGSLGHRLIVTKRKKGQSSAQYLTQRQRMWRHWTDS